MSKGKVLIYYSVFRLGGAEKSTAKLITKLLDLGYEVEVLLVSNGGEFQSAIDQRAKVSWLRTWNFGDKYQAAKGLKKYWFAFLYLLTRFEEYIKGISYWSKKYKAVIIGLHGLSPEFCFKNIKADTYLQYIRNDLRNCDENGKAQNQIKIFGKRIDHYVCVSQTALDSFQMLFPDLKEKGVKIYNLLEADRILTKSKVEIYDVNFSKDYLNILTVCRVQNRSKGIYRMANVMERLLKDSFKIKWYIVGDGVDFDQFKAFLKERHLSEHMILLGRRENPYPYFLKADVVAVFSYYEGLCGVVNEAKILERPLLATEFSGVREQIKHGHNGYVFENNEEAIYRGVKELLNKPEEFQKTAINEMPESITSDDYKVRELSLLF
jgi:glycosyltransferase involved in cell wall biosynthesis